MSKFSSVSVLVSARCPAASGPVHYQRCPVSHAMEKLTNLPETSPTLRDTYGTLETRHEADDDLIQYANWGAKCLKLRRLAEARRRF